MCARRATVFPAVVPITDVLIHAFDKAGLPQARAIPFGHVLLNYVAGFSLSEADHMMHPAPGPTVDPPDGVRREKVLYGAAFGDEFRRYVNDAVFASDDQFALGLRLLVQGLEAPAR